MGSIPAVATGVAPRKLPIANLLGFLPEIVSFTRLAGSSALGQHVPVPAAGLGVFLVYQAQKLELREQFDQFCRIAVKVRVNLVGIVRIDGRIGKGVRRDFLAFPYLTLRIESMVP
jgi:hypothetical protein